MRTRPVPAALLAGTLLLGAAASAQRSVAPAAWDVIVTVRKSRTGADSVSFGPRAPGYPPELLQRQMARLGEILKSGARGVMIERVPIRSGDPSETIMRGACGVDGLIDAATGSLAVAPIAQAFAGAPAPYTVRRMLVSFDGVAINPGHTLAYHTAGRTSDLAFAGRSVGSSIEYDVRLLSQDPTRLVVHEAEALRPTDRATVRAPVPRGLDAATVALYSLAALAAGALVYCLLALAGRRSVAKS